MIEDAAHAVDSFSKGRPCGGIGDVGIYSFDAIKNLTTGEGGGITGGGGLGGGGVGGGGEGLGGGGSGGDGGGGVGGGGEGHGGDGGHGG